MLKKILFLSGSPEQRAELLEPIMDKFQADVNHVFADIINYEDFARLEKKAAYSDIKKRFKQCLNNPREWIVINIPSDVKSAWQTYVDVCLQDPIMRYIFYGFSVDQTIRPVKAGPFPYVNYCDVDKAKATEVLNQISYS